MLLVVAKFARRFSSVTCVPSVVQETGDNQGRERRPLFFPDQFLTPGVGSIAVVRYAPAIFWQVPFGT